MVTGPRISNADAQVIAADFIDVLSDVCERVAVAGSVRRRKPFVKDVEILFVPRFMPDPNPPLVYSDFFRDPPPAPLINQAELVIAHLLESGLVRKRPNVNGIEAWGYKNKLGIHGPSGIAVDLFTATAGNFFNYLVCRTGGERTNIAIAAAARARGWKWNPYGEGFSRAKGLGREFHPIHSEREVFEFVGLSYREPWRRE